MSDNRHAVQPRVSPARSNTEPDDVLDMLDATLGREALLRDSAHGAHHARYSRQGEAVLGDFILLRELGAGGFATAYLAQQQSIPRYAVVKIAHPHLVRGAHRENTVTRFETEFRASSRVDHPNVITVYTSGTTDDGLPAIAMEYVPGKPLEALLRQQAPLKPRLLLKMFIQLARALVALHGAQIIHRDLSPNNIIITRRAHDNKLLFKIIDFGVARLTGAPPMTVGPVGTMRYTAPEQLMGEACCGSDIFSLGAVLWWAITGREFTPAAAHAAAGAALFHRLRGARVDMPADLAQLICQMLHPKPELRPDAETLCARLPALAQPWLAAAANTTASGTLPPGTSLASNDPELFSTPAASMRSTGRHSAPPQPPAPTLAAALHASSPALALHNAQRAAGPPTQRIDARVDGALGNLPSAQRELLIDTAIGRMPDLLAALDDGLDARDPRATAAQTKAIEALCAALGAEHMAALARTLSAYVTLDQWDQARALGQSLQDSYMILFRELIALRANF